jgi:toluene monooxygenase system protein D
MTRSGSLVGPVLQTGESAFGVVAAIHALNASVSVKDHGSYLRVLVPGRCVVTRTEIERQLGRPFHFPTDLEAVMPAFQGRFSVNSDEATWSTAEP